MIMSVIHRIDDQYAVPVPAEEIARLGLVEGQQVEVMLTRLNPDDERRKSIDAIMDDVVVKYRDAFSYLAAH